MTPEDAAATANRIIDGWPRWKQRLAGRSVAMTPEKRAVELFDHLSEVGLPLDAYQYTKATEALKAQDRESREDERLRLGSIAELLASENPLSMEYETDAREIWPERWKKLTTAMKATNNESGNYQDY